MNTLTNKLMSATLGLALALGGSVAMTTASGVLGATDAEARTLSRSKIIGGGQKIERSKIDFGKLKDRPAKRELARQRIIEGGAKTDLAKRIGEKRAQGRI